MSGKKNENLKLAKGIFGMIGGVLALIIPFKALPGILADNKKAIKAKQLQYPLICLVFFASLIATIITLVSCLVTDDNGTFFKLIVAIAVLVVSAVCMKRVRASLVFFCDDCGKRVDYVANFATTGSKTQTKTKEVVVGSHIEVNFDKKDAIEIREVVDKEKRYAGSTTTYSGKIFATLTCPACGKKKEMTMLHSSYSPNASSEVLKKAILDSAVAENRKKNFPKK